jgi:hypothetical protein
LPDTTVTDLRRLDTAADTDAESPTTPHITTSNDPYNIGHGLKTEEEIAELRSRKRGKRLAKYHRKQNDVSASVSSFFLANNHAQLIASLLKPMEEHIEDARNEEDLSRIPVSVCLSY